MSVHVYRARCAESTAEHEILVYLMAEDKRAAAVRSGRSTRRDRRRLRHAAVSMRVAEMNWLAAVICLLTWGLS